MKISGSEIKVHEKHFYANNAFIMKRRFCGIHQTGINKVAFYSRMRYAKGYVQKKHLLNPIDKHSY